MLCIKKLVLNTAFIIIFKVDPVRTREVRKETGNAGMQHPKWGTEELVILRLYSEAVSYRGCLGRLICTSSEM